MNFQKKSELHNSILQKLADGGAMAANQTLLHLGGRNFTPTYSVNLYFQLFIRHRFKIDKQQFQAFANTRSLFVTLRKRTVPRGYSSYYPEFAVLAFTETKKQA